MTLKLSIEKEGHSRYRAKRGIVSEMERGAASKGRDGGWGREKR